MPNERDDHPELPVDPDLESAGPPGQAVSRDEATRPQPHRTRPQHTQPMLLVLVAGGGFVGAASRYGISQGLPTHSGGWPTGTFLVNLVGAFVLGLLLEALARRGPDEGWRRRTRLLLGTGFCGAFTTYSTLAVEADLLVRDGSACLAAGYAAVSLLAGLAASAAGIAVAVSHHQWRRAGRRAGE